LDAALQYSARGNNNNNNNNNDNNNINKNDNTSLDEDEPSFKIVMFCIYTALILQRVYIVE